MVIVVEELSWFAVWTRARHEGKVDRQVRRLGQDCFLPLVSSRRRWSDRWKEVQLPLFPGYVFVRIHPDTALRVERLASVVSVVRGPEGPAAIPEDEIDSIRRLTEAPTRVELFPSLVEGREVVITKGALRGIRGTLVERRGAYRVVVSVNLLQQGAAVEIQPSDVEPV